MGASTSHRVCGGSRTTLGESSVLSLHLFGRYDYLCLLLHAGKWVSRQVLVSHSHLPQRVLELEAHATLFCIVEPVLRIELTSSGKHLYPLSHLSSSAPVWFLGFYLFVVVLRKSLTVQLQTHCYPPASVSQVLQLIISLLLNLWFV